MWYGHTVRAHVTIFELAPDPLIDDASHHGTRPRRGPGTFQQPLAGTRVELHHDKKPNAMKARHIINQVLDLHLLLLCTRGVRPPNPSLHRPAGPPEVRGIGSGMNLTTLKGGGEGARDERWIQKDYIMA
jgi:hypothetical protein